MLTPGTTFGRYRLAGEIRRGSSVSIFVALDWNTDAPVFLKVLHSNNIAASRERGPDFVKDLFLREARIIAEMAHPYVVKLVDQGQEGDLPFIALEWVPPGTSVNAVLSSTRRPFGARDGMALARALAGALSAVHHAGYIHRDVSPANFLVGGTSYALSDFGYALRLTGDPLLAYYEEQRTQGVHYGTPGFMAPEMAELRTVGDIRSDIWSLGATLYFAWTGQYAYTFLSDSQWSLLVQQLRRAGVPEPNRRRDVPHLPEGVLEILERCLRPNPADRYQSVAEVDAALAALRLP